MLYIVFQQVAKLLCLIDIQKSRPKLETLWEENLTYSCGEVDSFKVTATFLSSHAYAFSFQCCIIRCHLKYIFFILLPALMAIRVLLVSNLARQFLTGTFKSYPGQIVPGKLFLVLGTSLEIFWWYSNVSVRWRNPVVWSSKMRRLQRAFTCWILFT